MTTPDSVFCATGSAGCRNIVDNGNDLPTDPSAHATCSAPCAPAPSGTADVNVA